MKSSKLVSITLTDILFFKGRMSKNYKRKTIFAILTITIGVFYYSYANFNKGKQGTGIKTTLVGLFLSLFGLIVCAIANNIQDWYIKFTKANTGKDIDAGIYLINASYPCLIISLIIEINNEFSDLKGLVNGDVQQLH